MGQIHRLVQAALVAGMTVGWGPGGEDARADERDCPSHPEATYALQGDPDADRSFLEKLAKPAQDRGAVCIAAYYDAQGPANGKMLAFRRANWAMEQLTSAGVPAGIISRALRASDKSNAHLVQVIIGP